MSGASGFDRAVKLALVSDVPVGIFLSGGMDSSLVAESAMRQGRLSCAYFLDFEEQSYSEHGAAKAVADRLGLPLETVTLTSDDLVDFPSLVAHADDPLADSSALAVYVLSRLAVAGNKVVLGGDGGDELFGGYLTYLATRPRRVTRRLPGPLRRALAAVGNRLPTGEKKVTTSYKLWRFLRAADLPEGIAHFTWNGTWLPRGRSFMRGRGREKNRAARPRVFVPGSRPAPALEPARPAEGGYRGISPERHPDQGRPHEHGPRPRGSRALPADGHRRLRADLAGPTCGVRREASRRGCSESWRAGLTAPRSPTPGSRASAYRSTAGFAVHCGRLQRGCSRTRPYAPSTSSTREPYAGCGGSISPAARTAGRSGD